MTIFGLKMIVKSGLDFFFEIPLAPPEILLINQANSVFLGSFFCTGHQQLWWGAQNFKKKNSRPLFTVIFKPKMVISRFKILVHLFWLF